MIIIIGILVLCITWGIAVYQKIRYGSLESPPAIVGITMMVFILTLIPMAIIWSNAKIGDIAGQREHTYAIASLKSDTAIIGSFFLGTGGVDKERQFYFLQQIDNGGYIIKSWPSDQSVIFQEKDCKSRVVIVCVERYAPWWLIPFPCRMTQLYNKGTAYFYIPENSIISEFRPL